MNQLQAIEQFSLFGASKFIQPRSPSESASLRKSNGQFLAARKAGKLWQENALVALERFIRVSQGDVTGDFTFEDFRTWCQVQSMLEPDSLCAWGALPAVACKRGMCEWTGRVTTATRPASHGRLIKVWRKK